MAIPDYQACMLPLLEALGDGKDHHIQKLTGMVADRFGLTDAERDMVLPSGRRVIVNRVGWAKTYLKKAGLVTNPRRGTVRITPEGSAALQQKPQRIDTALLNKYPGFKEFVEKQSPEPAGEEAMPNTATPEEALEVSYSTLRSALADELLDRMNGCTPAFFERLVVDLLVAMGYGGSIADAGQAIGKTGDGGIDGIIKEDKLGLDVVCIQAKRWKQTVGRPEVQAFAGSMEGFRARKGVLITTSAFSKEAEEFVRMIERKIVLIDGQRLAQLMIDHGIGVAVAREYVVKKLDQDYFDEDGD
jgi:restriction system protein